MNSIVHVNTLVAHPAIPDDELDDIRDTLAQAVRKNTRAAYSDGWTDFVRYCTSIRADADNATAETVSRYLKHLQRSGKKLSTIRARRAAVSARFGGKQNAANPALQPGVAKLMQGIGNQLAIVGRARSEEARPISLLELRAMVAALPDTIATVRDRAILCIGWWCGMRRSEISALDCSDLIFRDDSIQVVITNSKTQSVTDSDVVTVPIMTDMPDVCPTRHARAWLTAGGIASGAVFVRIDRWGNTGRRRLTSRHVDSVVKRAATAAKLPPSERTRISGHSLRAGVATELARSGAATWEIRGVTRHKGDAMLNRYIRTSGAQTMTTYNRIARRAALA